MFLDWKAIKKDWMSLLKCYVQNLYPQFSLMVQSDSISHPN
jgi:hypothetical protein